MIVVMKNQSLCKLCGCDVLESLTIMRIANDFGCDVEFLSLTVCGYCINATIYSPSRTVYLHTCLGCLATSTFYQNPRILRQRRWYFTFISTRRQWTTYIYTQPLFSFLV